MNPEISKDLHLGNEALSFTKMHTYPAARHKHTVLHTQQEIIHLCSPCFTRWELREQSEFQGEPFETIVEKVNLIDYLVLLLLWALSLQVL